MIGATRKTEITVHVANQPAALGKLMAITVSCGADVLAAHSYWDGTNSVLRLVTEDTLRTTHALQAAGFNCTSSSVVLVEIPDKPGLSAVLGNKLAGAGIEVHYSYAFHPDTEHTYVVFKTNNDNRAVYVLEVDALIHELAAARSWHQVAAKRDAESEIVQHAA